MRLAIGLAVLLALQLVCAGTAKSVVEKYDSLGATSIPLEQVSISLSRTRCLGECPVYSVTILGSGEVLYKGVEWVAVTGRASGSISIEKVVELVNKALSVHFFDAERRYETQSVVSLGEDGELEWGETIIFDQPSTTVSIRLGSHEHTVTMYYNTPIGLVELADAIDEIAETEQWVGTSER